MRHVTILLVFCARFAGVSWGQEDERNRSIGEVRVNFTVGVEYRSRTGLVFQSMYHFDDAAWNFLWPDLGVSNERLEEVSDAVQIERTFIPVLPDFPLLSRLMFIDEGVVRYRKLEIEELRRECVRLKGIVAGKPSENLIDSLYKATAEAKNKNGEVLVHPFGWSGRRNERYTTERRDRP